MIKAKSTRKQRIVQGDIIRDVECIEYVAEKKGVVEVSKIVFPLVVVLTQDCDLEQDYRFRTEEKATQDKWLMSVLVAPLYNLEHVHQGEHLSELEIKMEPISKKGSTGNNLRQNQSPRYHFLEFPTSLPIVPSVIDFKHYFSVHVEYLRNHKKKKFVCTVSELFREDISQRFSSYLSRIGLPA